MATATSSSPAAATAPAPSSSGRYRIVFRTMQLLVLLVTSLGVVIAVEWLVLNPRPPVFRLNSLSLSGLSNNASNASSPPPELHVLIQLTATNPNKKLLVVIRDVIVSLCLKPIPCRRWLPLLRPNSTSSSEYYIGKRGRQVLAFDAKAGPRPGHGSRRTTPFPCTVGEGLRKGSAVMSLRMKASVKFMHGYWPSKQASVEVTCSDLSIRLSSGKLKDGGKDCYVHFT